MKKALLIIGLLFFVGCHTPVDYAALRTQREEALKQEFREAYGDAWQQKYLEYKLEIKKLEAANPQPIPDIVTMPAMPALTRPMGSMELYQNYENRARQLNRDNDLGSIEQSLREMSRYQKYGY